MKEDDIIAAFDIGSTAIRAIMMGVDRNGESEVLAAVETPSKGIKHGQITNINEAVKCIEEIASQLEEISGYSCGPANVSYSGRGISCMNSRGVVGIQGKGRDRNSREVTNGDVERVLNVSKEVAIGMDKEMLHAISGEFIVDGRRIEVSPVGTIGTRLEAVTHIITCPDAAVQSLIETFNRSGYELHEIVHGLIGASCGLLSEEEKERGILFVDFGSGGVSFQVYRGGTPLFTSSLPVGGAHVTNDIAIMLGIRWGEAEGVKRESACAWAPLIREDENVLVPGSGEALANQMSKMEICKIVHPRIEEIYNSILSELTVKKIDIKRISSVVLIGGEADLPGIAEAGEEIFHLPVRIGIPGEMPGLKAEWRKSSFASVVGLGLYSIERLLTQGRSTMRRQEGFQGLLSRFFGR